MKSNLKSLCCLLFLFILVPGLAYSAGKTDHETAVELYNRGCAALGHDAKEAEDFYQESLDVYPSYEGYYSLGRMQLRRGSYLEALHSFNQANSLGARAVNRAVALGMSALALASLGREREGWQAVQAAMELHPDPPWWMRGIAAGIENDVIGKVASAGEISRCLDPPQNRGIGITPSINLSVHFDYDSYTLNEQGIRQIRELAKALAQKKFLSARFLIIGHTDLQGNWDYNQKLSEKRAETAMAMLEQLEPRLKGHLRAIGKGMSSPIRRSMDYKAHQINRRVEVRRDEE